MAQPARSTAVEPTDAPMVWHGWGDPTQRHGLPAGARSFLEARIGPLGTPRTPVPLEEVRVGPCALDTAARAALIEVVGTANLLDDHRSRVEHAGGKSYPDLVRRRRGEAVTAPDAIVRPADHGQVQRTLEVCVEHRIAVVPFGGGTSVVGGVEPERAGFEALIALDVGRMRRLTSVEPGDRTATFEPGLRGPQAEALLAEHGLTLGHFPQSYEYATIGGYVATRSAGQASTGYGRIDDLVLGLRCATPRGELRVGRGVATAAGPDLRALLTGSEGTLGILTELTLQVHPAPEVEHHEAFVAPSFASGAATLRALVHAGAAPHVARLSDEDETGTALAQIGGARARALRAYLRARGIRRPCLLVLGWEGTPAQVAGEHAATVTALRGRRVVGLGTSAGASWAAGRFRGPYLRDELLDHGVMVETLETATTWSRLGALYTAVRAALTDTLRRRGTPPLVLCHISHVYPTGASLYFTWIARQEDGAELEQWRAAKHAASQAIVDHQATITHHHAVGIDHRDWMPDEVGELGLEALRGVKDRLDPTGIMNPGKLLPTPDAPGGPATRSTPAGPPG